jgi:acetyltransferase
VIALDARIALRPALRRPCALRFALIPRNSNGTSPPRKAARSSFGQFGRRTSRSVLEAFRRLDPADVRMRFFAAVKEMPHEQAARLIQIDYDREMALIALPKAATSASGWHCAPFRRPRQSQGGVAIIVRSDLKGRGIGACLMRLLIDYARARGYGTLIGEVLAENAAMLALARDLGFSATNRWKARHRQGEPAAERTGSVAAVLR